MLIYRLVDNGLCFGVLELLSAMVCFSVTFYLPVHPTSEEEEKNKRIFYQGSEQEF